MKILTLDEVLKEIEAKVNENTGKVVYNRFNKEKFNKLLVAMANNMDMTAQMAIVKKNELTGEETISVTEGFRKFCKKIVEKAGVDKVESEKVLSKDFKIDDVEGLYEFFTEAMYLYMEKGNRFNMIPKKDFKGSLLIKKKPKSTVEKEEVNPSNQERQRVKTETEEHMVLAAKSTVPAYLKKRTKLS